MPNRTQISKPYRARVWIDDGSGLPSLMARNFSNLLLARQWGATMLDNATGAKQWDVIDLEGADVSEHVAEGGRRDYRWKGVCLDDLNFESAN